MISPEGTVRPTRKTHLVKLFALFHERYVTKSLFEAKFLLRIEHLSNNEIRTFIFRVYYYHLPLPDSSLGNSVLGFE